MEKINQLACALLMKFGCVPGSVMLDAKSLLGNVYSGGKESSYGGGGRCVIPILSADGCPNGLIKNSVPKKVRSFLSAFAPSRGAEQH